MKKNRLPLMLMLGLALGFSCKDDSTEPETPPVQTGPLITVSPATVHQQMIGFGGALTWYSDRVITNSKRDELYQLMFEDLGMDILRLKNWYYPQDYPENKSPQTMLTTGDKTMFEATNTFYAKAKEFNPDIQVLLSSWGPPPSLKSNNHLREGTLKKDEDGYMYDAFAQYWVDILDNIDFNPDYISIQNEPGYTNPGWTTCNWSPTESSTLAGYEQAFDRVYDRIKDRTDAPLMMGPESENLQAFMSFAPVLRNKESCPIYAYHPYNFNAGIDINQTNTLLSSLRSNFGDKPNIMTEYSNMPWFKTARFIHRNLKNASTSGYIYWELVWGDPLTREMAMIYVDGSGYTINPFYYVVKHYSKYIDRGYHRVEVTATNASLEVTAYMRPDQQQLTLVVINPATTASKYALEVDGHTIKTVKAYQTVEGNYFRDMGSLEADAEINLPPSSITTLVLSL